MDDYNRIYILTTGGTIEGIEYDNIDDAPKLAPISIQEHLLKINGNFDYIIKQVFLKDSRLITDNDRNKLLHEIKSLKSSKILITHGTLTMVETAIYLGKLKLNKTIVLTGALILGTNKSTDAPFNLAFAVDTLTYLNRGVYIAMHGRIFYWDNVRKNLEENRFETL